MKPAIDEPASFDPRSPENRNMDQERYKNLLVQFPDFEKLSPREQKVLGLRLGLYDEKFYSLREIAKQFSVLSVTRIHQIEQKALCRLNGEVPFKLHCREARTI